MSLSTIIYIYMRDYIPATIAIGATAVIYWQLRLIRKQMNLQAFTDIHKELHCKQGKEDRKFIYDLRSNYDFEDVFKDKSKKEDRLTIERVCDAFEHAGLLVNAGIVDCELFYDAFYTVLLKCWDILEPYVMLRRRDNERSA